LAALVLEDFEVGGEVGYFLFGVRHQSDAHSLELGDWVVDEPSLKLLLQGFVVLEMAVGEELLWVGNESKVLNDFVVIVPRCLVIDFETELFPIFKLNVDFIDSLVCSQFDEFVDIAKWKYDGLCFGGTKYAYFIICY
jgi:hypothetical protein